MNENLHRMLVLAAKSTRRILGERVYLSLRTSATGRSINRLLAPPKRRFHILIVDGEGDLHKESQRYAGLLRLALPQARIHTPSKTKRIPPNKRGEIFRSELSALIQNSPHTMTITRQNYLSEINNRYKYTFDFLQRNAFSAIVIMKRADTEPDDFRPLSPAIDAYYEEDFPV